MIVVHSLGVMLCRFQVCLSQQFLACDTQDDGFGSFTNKTSNTYNFCIQTYSRTSIANKNHVNFRTGMPPTFIQWRNLILLCLLHCGCREEYDLLEAVQTRLAHYPLTSPLLGNSHNDFRGRGCPVSSQFPVLLESIGEQISVLLSLGSVHVFLTIKICGCTMSF